MFLVVKLAVVGFVSLVALPAAIRPERYTTYIEPFPSARYVVTGRVSSGYPRAPAHFRLEVVSSNSSDGPQPGRTIDVRFVNDLAAVPAGGALIEIGLLGERDGVFLVGPTTQYRIVTPPPNFSGVSSSADVGVATTWTVTAGAGVVALCVLFVALRSVRRGPRRPAV